MDFRFTEEAQSFRREVAGFLEETLTEEFRNDPELVHEGGFSREFTRRLGERGWLTLAWPEQYGGQERSHFDQLVYNEEMARHAAPGRAHMMAVSLVGPSVMVHGNDEQRAEYLPRIARGEVVFCQGFSEPGAGSDLAGLQLRAEREGDEYLVNGQKIWTSDAHRADFCWIGTRTDPDAPKHRGISTFILDMSSPGITVRPLLSMGDHHHFNEVFFEDVRLPADNRVGDENRGWYHMTTTLDFERSGAAAFVGAQKSLDRLARYRREERAGDEPPGVESAHRSELTQLFVDANVGRWISYRVVWQQSAGMIPNYEASMSKLFGSTLGPRIANTGVKIAGLFGQLRPGSPLAPIEGALEDAYVWGAAAGIRGGTNEIQRNIIATRGLGLPRG
jgi:alkylation response protein AidB-like acyl-CoA dehydrogenase